MTEVSWTSSLWYVFPSMLQKAMSTSYDLPKLGDGGTAIRVPWFVHWVQLAFTAGWPLL